MHRVESSFGFSRDPLTAYHLIQRQPGDDEPRPVKLICHSSIHASLPFSGVRLPLNRGGQGCTALVTALSMTTESNNNCVQLHRHLQEHHRQKWCPNVTITRSRDQKQHGCGRSVWLSALPVSDAPRVLQWFCRLAAIPCCRRQTAFNDERTGQL